MARKHSSFYKKTIHIIGMRFPLRQRRPALSLSLSGGDDWLGGEGVGSRSI